MKIGINALYSMSGGYGGMQVYLENLLEELLRIDNENEYFIFCNKENFEIFLSKNWKAEKIQCPVSSGLSISKTLWEQFILPLQAKKRAVDLLFSPAYITPLNIKCKTVTTIHCIKYIHHPRDFDNLTLKTLDFFIPRSSRKSDRIITVSQYTRKELIDYFKADSSLIDVIPYSVGENFNISTPHKEDIRKKYGIRGKFVLSVASTKSHKNVKGLVEAFAVLKENEKIEHQLVLVGDKRPLLKNDWFGTQFSRWEKDIIFTGFIPNNELPPLYRNADLFVFASKYESFGIPVIEAMSCGAPVVTSTVSALPEVAGGCALLADPYNVSDIAEKMKALMKDKPLREKMISGGLEHVKQFSWRRTAIETLNVFRKTMETN